MLMGFPVTHSGHSLPHVHGIGIHHPGHDLFVGVDVGSGNIFFGPDEFDKLRGVAASHALDLAHRHLVRIADHAALGAAERNVDHGALPGHPAGKRADFIEGDVGRVADAALGRTARNRVLHAKSGEDLEMAVIHLDGDVDRELAVGIAQHPPQAVVEIELLGSEIKARPLRLPRIAFFVDVRGGCHRGHKICLRNDCG